MNVVKFLFDARRFIDVPIATQEIGAPTLPAIVAGIDRDNRAPAGLSITGANAQLRKARKQAWRRADAARQYWKDRLALEHAINQVQHLGVEEGRLHPPFDPKDRWIVLDRYREAIAKQLLTPAPDTMSVKWKQAALAQEGRRLHDSVTAAQIERVIAKDTAFLAAHPIRQSNRRSTKEKG